MTPKKCVRTPSAKDRLGRLADFLFEAGMLRKTPRTGYQFLGTGAENVAEHSFRTAVVGFVLAELAGADSSRTAMLCLFHDVHEARIGDFNYVNRIYNTSLPDKALAHALAGTGLEEKIQGFWQELCKVESLESALAQDADQIDLILNLKVEHDLGNPYARKWMECACARLRTTHGKKLAETVMATDHTDWWFKEPDPAWWTNGNGGE